MEEALNFFLNNENIHASIDAPDEAIDYIFMLDDSELDVLAKEWDSRDNEWKSAISYLIGNLKLHDIQDFLLKGLADNDSAVVEQTLLSLHQSITENETDNLDIFEDIKNSAFVALEKINSKYPEIRELKNILSGK